MLSSVFAPIAVFCFNRPQHLQLTLEALGHCDDYEKHPLYIYCDAPRDDRDQLSCAATQAVAHKWVEIYGGEVIVRPHNMHFDNLLSGISEMNEKFGKVIIIEDDIVVSPDFLTFMQSSLEKYQDDERVYLVGGHMYDGMQNYEASTFFLPHAYIWGWATWQRAWKNYSKRPKGWRDLLEDKQRLYRFDYYGNRKNGECLQTTLENQGERMHTWDVQWSYIVFNSGGVGLYSSHNMVWNTGLDCGVHNKNRLSSLAGYDVFIHGKAIIEDYQKMRLPSSWCFPEKVEVDEKAFSYLAKLFRKNNFRKKWSRKIRKNLKRLLKIIKP